MSTFFGVSNAGQSFSEQANMMGEVFTYQNVSLRGVFDQVQLDYEFSEESFRRVTALVLVTSKAQWVTAGKVPANRENVVCLGKSYPIQKIAGESDQEPAWTLTLFQLT